MKKTARLIECPSKCVEPNASEVEGMYHGAVSPEIFNKMKEEIGLRSAMLAVCCLIGVPCSIVISKEKYDAIKER